MKIILTVTDKRILYLSVILLPFLLLFSFTDDESILITILKKMQAYDAEHKQEKLYLHFDKPFYSAGENIWFKGYLVEASLHNLDSLSRVVYVELIDSSKAILQRKVLYAENGLTYGDLLLPDSLHEGKYVIRAYTNYMKNVDEGFFFMKEFSILSSPERKRVVVTRGSNNSYDPSSIDLQFYPEGGNFIACGSYNRLAFKALSPDGKSIAVEGYIVDENNTVIIPFKTQHDGMGMLRLNPIAGKVYTAHIKKPYPVNHSYPLPRLRNKGYIMQVDELGKNIKIVVFTNESIPSSGKLSLSLVIQSRGKVYHAQQGFITSNAFFTYIPRSKFPDGITQITLFNSQGEPVAERLVYQDQGESISIVINTDSLSYGKRSLATACINAHYKNGAPALGSFSMTVYDDVLVQSQEKYPLTIKNYLSLTSDLKGHIENPGYYFKDSLPETKKNMDLLMMVHGWRRFTWKEVLEDNRAPLKFNREQGIPISGSIQKSWGKKIPPESNLKIMTMKGDVVIVQPDSLGRFYSDGLLYYDTADLVIQTENAKGKKQPYKVLLNPFNITHEPEYTLTGFTSFDASKYLEQQEEFNRAFYKTAGVTILDEVKIVEKKERDTRKIGFQTDPIINIPNGGSGYTHIFQLLQARIPGLVVNGNPPNMTVQVRGQTPAFLMNGMNLPVEMLSMLSPTDVEGIEFLRNGAALYGANSVINILLKVGSWENEPSLGINQVKYPGFYQTREFYSPRYEVPNDRHSLPDKRTTLHWEPMLVTDDEGRTEINFYTADVLSRYRIEIEGITQDGYPGVGSVTFEVK